MANQLEDLLRACTVRVTGGPAPGAGFFVAPGRVLTCVHVIGDSTELVVRWECDGQSAREAQVSGRVAVLADRGRPIPALDCDYPDVAVLEIEGLDSHPCVRIDTQWPSQEDSFQVFGYPEEGGAVQLTPARLTYRGVRGTLPTAYLDLASDTIRPGMSGAAVLNLRSGAVCGVVVASKHPDRPDGALAIPWSAVGQELAGVLIANRSFHASDRRWEDASTAHQERLRLQLDAVHAAAGAADIQEFADLLAEPMVGREWLVAEVEAFHQEHDRGYFLIEGGAGMGKTTFAAWLAQDRDCAAHFAQFDSDAGTNIAVVRNIGARLIADWNLDGLMSGGALMRDTDGAQKLRAIFRAAADRRDEIDRGKRILVVVDALDAAADHPAEHLPLGLPDRLPRGVFVVATVRTGGLRHDPRQHAPGECVWRSLDQARDENTADLRQYLSPAVNEKYLAEAIARAGIAPERFIELLLDRSLGVWVYVRYVLEEIRQHPESAGSLPQLPRGLRAYYHNNLARVCDGADGSLHLRLLAALVAAGEYVDASMLTAFASIDGRDLAEYALDHALSPYCSVTPASGPMPRRFKIRHPSLSEYVTGGPILDAWDAEAAGQPDDPLRERLAAACMDAHRRIADHYLRAWGGLKKGLPRLKKAPERGAMDGGYPLRRMAAHLLAADRQDDLHDLLARGRRGNNIWFAAHDSIGDIDGYLRDVNDARNATEQLSEQVRYALLSASVTSQASALPPALVGELVRRKLWTVQRAFSHIERIANEQRQAQALARIAPRLTVKLLGPALAVAMRCQQADNRRAALQALIPHPGLHDSLLERAVDAFFSIGNSSPETLLTIAARLPQELLLDLDARHGRNYRPREYLRAAVAFFSASDRSQGARNALAAARQTDNQYERGLLIAALLPLFPGELFDVVLAVLSEIDRQRSRYLHPALTALARYSPAGRLGDLLDFAADKSPEPGFFRQAVPRLTAEQIQTALRLCQAEPNETDRVRIFIELSQCLGPDQARQFLAPPPGGYAPLAGRMWCLAIGEFLQLYDKRHELPVVGMLLERLPEPEASTVLADLTLSHSFNQPVTKMADLFLTWPGFEPSPILERHAKYSPDHLRQGSLKGICENIKAFTDDTEEKALRLTLLAPFSQDEVATIFDIVKEASWPEADVIVADVLAPHLHEDQLVLYAASRVMEYPVEEECFTALAGLGAFQTPTARDRTAMRALALADSISDRGKKARAVAALAPILIHPDMAARAFEIARSAGPFWMAKALDPLAPTLPAELLEAIPDAIRGRPIPALVQDIRRTLERLSRERRTACIDNFLPLPRDPQGPLPWRHGKETRHLAPYLSVSQAQRLWQIGDPDTLHPEQAETLAALARRLPDYQRAAAVDELLAAYSVNAVRRADIDRRAWFLGQLARTASTEQLTQALRDFLVRCPPSHASTVLKELAPGLPGALIGEAFHYAISDEFESVPALAALAPRLSGPLLTHAITFLSNTTGSPPGKASALVAISGQLPPHDREKALNLAFETALSWPYQAWREGVMTSLIPQLPDGLRAQAIDAFADWACDELRLHLDNETFEDFCKVLAVLQGPELEQLYDRLDKKLQQPPRARARAQAAVLRIAAKDHGTGFAHHRPLHGEWPGDLDRAGLMDLIGASAWWIYRNGNEPAIREVVEAVFDVVHWWPG